MINTAKKFTALVVSLGIRDTISQIFYFIKKKILQAISIGQTCDIWLAIQKSHAFSNKIIDRQDNPSINFSITIIVSNTQNNSALQTSIESINLQAYAKNKIHYQELIDVDIDKLITSSDADFAILMMAGDRLWPNALANLAQFILKNSDAVLIYGDEEIKKINGCYALLKPKFSPILFRNSFYTGWPLILRTGIAKKYLPQLKSKGFSRLFELSLVLQENKNNLKYVTKILQTRCIHDDSYDSNKTEALQCWVDEHGMVAEIVGENNQLRVYQPARNTPRISIIIPTRNQYNLLKACIESLEKSIVTPYEIIVIDNNSDEKDALGYLKRLQRQNTIKVLPYRKPFNFSAMMNFGAEEAKGDILVFLNNDTEMINDYSLLSMAEELMSDNVAAVGPLLVYPDDTIQHAGLVCGMGIVAGHLYKGQPLNEQIHFVNPLITREVGAIDGACFMVHRNIFLLLRGFDQENLAISFSDVDFCLKARKAGYHIVYTPHAKFIHHEGKTRNDEFDQQEATFIEKKWENYLKHDPYYHSALSLLDESGRFSVPVWQVIKIYIANKFNHRSKNTEYLNITLMLSCLL